MSGGRAGAVAMLASVLVDIALDAIDQRKASA